MRLTIIVEDKAIGVDGVFYSPLDMSFIPTGVSALQWYDTYGEVEYSRVIIDGQLQKPQNEIITELGVYSQAIDLWSAANVIANTVKEVQTPAE